MNRATFLMLAASLLPLPAFAGTSYDITIPDMHCEACSSALIGTFSKRPEVASAQADIPTHQLTVTLKDHAKLSEVQMRELVRASGFTADTIETR